MAKVTFPVTSFSTFQTLGKGITLRNRKEGFTVSKTSRPRLVSSEAEELIDETSEAKIGEWQGLTEGQKQDWHDLGEESFVDGMTAFMREGFKSSLQSLYGYARYGQNVYIKG